MPLDRRITLQIFGEGDYDEAGRFQEGVQVDHHVWATLLDTSLTRTLGQSGARGEEDAIYRVRYFAELAALPFARVKVQEADGDLYLVQKISEATGRFGDLRRRWLELECIRADTQ